MDNQKEIYLGLVERACRFGLKRWEPLNLSWNRMRCHGIIEAERHSGWLVLFKNIVQSVLKQDGRVLIINRHNQNLYDVEYKKNNINDKVQNYDIITAEVEIEKISFNNIAPQVINDFSELNDLKSFLWGRSKFNESSNRILYLPQSLSSKKNENDEPIITSMVRDFLNNHLVSTSKEIDSSDKSLEEAAPVLILTIGEPWYADEPILPAKLRALSISSFHLSFSTSDMHQSITDNSSTQIFIFNKKMNAAKINGVDGFVHYCVETGPPNFDRDIVNSLFKVK